MTHTHHDGCSHPESHAANSMIVDEMAVVRLLERFPINPTCGERIEATRLLTAQGQSADHIAEWLHVSKRTICRYRAKLATKDAK